MIIHVKHLQCVVHDKTLIHFNSCFYFSLFPLLSFFFIPSPTLLSLSFYFCPIGLFFLLYLFFISALLLFYAFMPLYQHFFHSCMRHQWATSRGQSSTPYNKGIVTSPCVPIWCPTLLVKNGKHVLQKCKLEVLGRDTETHCDHKRHWTGKCSMW